jgi:hypothetical protein
VRKRAGKGPVVWVQPVAVVVVRVCVWLVFIQRDGGYIWPERVVGSLVPVPEYSVVVEVLVASVAD